MRVSPYQRIRRCSYSSKELMHWPTSSSLFFSFFLGDPVDMVTPRSIYNDVNSPKIGFQYLLGWYQSQKNSLHRCMTLYQSQLGKVSRKKVAVLLDFVQITSTPPPLVPLFLNAKNVDFSDIQNDSLSKILLK